MAIAFVQQKENTTAAATTIAATFTGNTVSGNLIVVGIGHATNSQPFITGVSDGTNTYTQLVPAGNVSGGTPGSAHYSIWYAKNITGGVTPTVTAALSASIVATIAIVEVSGLDIIQPVDYLGQRYITGTATTTFCTLQTTELKTVNEFIFAFVLTSQSTGTFTALGSLTNLQQQNGTNQSSASATQIVASQSSLPVGFSLNANSSSVIGVATFADQTMPPYQQLGVSNNHQFVKVPDGLSTTEKIR